MKTISSIESFTGGLFAKTITDIPGASAFFKGSLVTYANEIKEKLGVDTSNGVINKKVAKEMAIKGKKFFNTNICVSFTGNAGPKAMENKKVGLVFISINKKVYEMYFEGNRENIRKQAVEFAFNKINKYI